jgi:hypothetical protein
MAYQSKQVACVPDTESLMPWTNAIQVIHETDDEDDGEQWVICGNGEYDVACISSKQQLRALALALLALTGGM